jgi:hypothetical protein
MLLDYQLIYLTYTSYHVSTLISHMLLASVLNSTKQRKALIKMEMANKNSIVHIYLSSLVYSYYEYRYIVVISRMVLYLMVDMLISIQSRQMHRHILT